MTTAAEKKAFREDTAQLIELLNSQPKKSAKRGDPSAPKAKATPAAERMLKDLARRRTSR